MALSTFERYWDEQVLLLHNHSTDRTLTKQRFGKIFTDAWDKAATPVNIKAGFRATGIYPFNPSIILHEAFAPSIVTHNEDAQVSNVVTLTEMPPSDPVSKKKNKTRKSSPFPGTSGTVAPTKRIPYILSSGNEDGADLERNAIIAPSQGTPQYLHTKLISKHPVNYMQIADWAVILKTNLFNVKQPSTWDDKKSATCSSGQKKRTNHLPKKSEENWPCFTCQRDDMQDVQACVLSKHTPTKLALD
jgi:hypothetical protein